MNTQARPTGITILAVLSAIGGIFGLLGGLALVFGGGLLGGLTGGATGGAVALWGVLMIVVAIVDLALAYGFWTIKAWAWIVGVAIQIVRVVLGLAIWLLASGSIVNVGVDIVIAAIILYYLMQPSIQALFGRTK